VEKHPRLVELSKGITDWLIEYPQLSKPKATWNRKTPSCGVTQWCPKTPSGDPMEKKTKNLGEPRLSRGAVLLWCL